VLTRFDVGILLMSLCAALANAQDFPSKPVRILTQPPGGGADFTSRQIAPELAASLGQPVIVDNRGGSIAVEVAAKAPPDGYTLLLFSNAMWIEPFLRESPWDPQRDFAPITLATNSPSVLVIHPSLRVRTVTDLIALAKARPGDLNYSSSGPGSSNQLSTELFKSMAGVNIVHIPYKGGGPALSALIAGEVQVLFANLGQASPHVKSGRLRAVAVTSTRETFLYPGVPPIVATLPGYESILILAIFAPARTPTPTINRLNQDFVRVLRTAELKEKFLNAGAEVAASSPAELSAAVKADMTRWGKVIKEAGIRAE